MKKSLASICSVACVGICSLAQAQNTDTTSRDFNHQGQRETIEETQSSTPPASTEEELQQDVNAMQENFEGATIDKVGPNGEVLFRERGKYFFINKDGKKTKVRKSDVRDKSEERNP